MNPIDPAFTATLDDAAAQTKNVYRKVTWRLMSFLILAVLVNAIDRINISFAKLHMAQDIALSDAAYGTGAAAFYLGYILFEVPSNLYLQRVGARATLARIMMLWGAVTACSAFIGSANQFIVARFALGVAESGFFAGVILYLTFWFPSAMRGRIIAVFLSAGIASGIVSGPLAGAIMSGLSGWMGMRDWQVLFVLEGLPAIILGIGALYWLDDKPEQARWLSRDEKNVIAAALQREAGKAGPTASWTTALRDPRVYLAGLVYFCIYSGTNTVSYWMPTLIRGLGVENIKTIGLLSTLPYLLAIAGMYLLGRSSDRRQERRWHVGLAMLVSAGSFLTLGVVHGDLPMSLGLMSVGTAAAYCSLSLFWTIPPAILPVGTAAASFAMISSMGVAAGVISQAVVGQIRTQTGSLYAAFDIIGATLIVGALVLLIVVPSRRVPD